MHLHHFSMRIQFQFNRNPLHLLALKIIKHIAMTIKISISVFGTKTAVSHDGDWSFMQWYLPQTISLPSGLGMGSVKSNQLKQKMLDLYVYLEQPAVLMNH